MPTELLALPALALLCLAWIGGRHAEKVSQRRTRYRLDGIGAMLKAERAKRGSTQTEVAAACDMKGSTLGRIECGKRPVHSIEMLQKLAGWLGKEGRDFL